MICVESGRVGGMLAQSDPAGSQLGSRRRVSPCPSPAAALSLDDESGR
jgi:hypothetical protein